MKDWPFDYFKYIANLNPEVLSRNMGTDFAPPGGGDDTVSCHNQGTGVLLTSSG